MMCTKWFEEKIREIVREIVLLHDSTNPHMTLLMKVIVATVGSEIVNHYSYSPDVASSDFHLFQPIKVLLGGQKFETNDELKCSTMNWLGSQEKNHLFCRHQ
jgi:hypothetical protein